MKHLKVITATFIAVATAFCAQGCMAWSGSGEKDGNSAGTLLTDSFTFAKKNKYADCRIVIDYPQDTNSPLGKSIVEYIANELHDDETEYDETETVAPSADMAWTSANEMLTYYGNEIFKDCVSQGKDLEESSPDLDDFSDAGYRNIEIRKGFETDKIVTYLTEAGGTWGGAHGWYYKKGLTFAKDDGRELSWQIFRFTESMEFKSLIIEGLKSYVHSDDGAVISDAGLKHALFLPDNIYALDLPTTSPFFTADGIMFIYQEYEIGPYSMGTPTFVIPYSKVKDFIADQYQDLLPQ